MITNQMSDVHNLLQAALFFGREMPEKTDPMVNARRYIELASNADFADFVEKQFWTDGRETTFRTLVNEAMKISGGERRTGFR
jgi:transcription elongation GreA/GreB family factor